MERTLISQTLSKIGQEIRVKGWVVSVRSHGQIVFVDLRDRSGLLQLVGDKKLASLRQEYIIDVTGVIRSRDEKYFNPKLPTGQIELEVKNLEVSAKSKDLPFDIHQPDLKVSLPTLLDYRSASLRNKKIRDVFLVQATITQTFRDYLTSLGFTEIFPPTIVATATEGGSQVFPIDYFGYKAYLAQSPQFYKQIMVGIFERVFAVAHAYRAEPSVTTRHMTEYVGLDVEMGFIDSWKDILLTADSVVKAIFKAVNEKHADTLKDYKVSVPKTVTETPIVKLKEAQQIIFERTGRDIRGEPDMDPEGEREICRWSAEKHGSDLVFITHFPTKKRPWYTYQDPDNPEETLGFDLIGCGVEWITGGQRIHDYEFLRSNIEKRGGNPDDFEIPYLQAFKYGMPPEGGFCIGLERVTQNILGLENVRQATLFPRDMERIDARLSLIGQKYQATPKIDLHQKLLNFLDEKSIKYQHLEHEEVKTSEAAAAARGTKLEQGAKALIMFADSQPILVVLSAAQKLDSDKFKKQFEIKDLRLATPQEAQQLSGVPLGAVPPFGNLFNLVTYVDEGLFQNPQIAFNAGSRCHSVIMKSSDFLNAINPKKGSFAV